MVYEINLGIIKSLYFFFCNNYFKKFENFNFGSPKIIDKIQFVIYDVLQ